jgi:hypothetical protein
MKAKLREFSTQNMTKLSLAYDIQSTFQSLFIHSLLIDLIIFD